MKSQKSYTRYLVLLLTLGTTLVKADSEQGFGKVNMTGMIFDSACEIDTESLDQTINMGETPINQLLELGYGPVKSFSIKLNDCNFTQTTRQKPNGFTISFDGPANGDFFILSGQAKGIKLALRDRNGQKITPMKTRAEPETEQDSTQLDYQLQLVTDGSFLRPGHYYTVLRFMINYY